MLKAIFFDLDDTLLDAQTPYREAIAATCAEAGRRCAGLDPERLTAIYIEVSRAMWRSFDLGQMSESAEEIRVRVWGEALRHAGVEDPALAREIAVHYGAVRTASHRLFPDALQTLESLHRRYHLGIITNGMTEIQREKIQRLGLEPYFDTILISQEVGLTKPDPRIFRMAIERVPCEPHEAVMIGDSPDRDIAGARAAGLRAVWVRTGWRRRDPCPSPGWRGVPKSGGGSGSLDAPSGAYTRTAAGPSPLSPSRGGAGGGVPSDNETAHAILDRLGELLPWLERQS